MNTVTKAANGQQLYWEMATNDWVFCMKVSVWLMILTASSTLLGDVLEHRYRDIAAYAFAYTCLMALIQIFAAAYASTKES